MFRNYYYVHYTLEKATNGFVCTRNGGWITFECFFWQKRKTMKQIRDWIEKKRTELDGEDENSTIVYSVVINKM